MSDLYNNLDAPIPAMTDWDKEYGLSKSIMALWDFSSTEGQKAACIVQFDHKTNAAGMADGVGHKINSSRYLNPENWVFRPHYVISENAKNGTWDVRLVAEHENQSDSRDNHGTMIVNQKNKKQWGWLNDIAWVRKLDTPAGDAELQFNDSGYLPALAGGKPNDKRSVVATPTCRNGGFVTDGKYDGQWSQAGKFIIGPAVADAPTPSRGTVATPGGGGANGTGNRGTVTSQVGNVGGGYSNTGIPNLNSGANGIGATYQGGGYGGLANPNLTYGQGSGVTLQGGGYGGLSNPGAVAGYSSAIGTNPQNNGPINQGGGYGGTSQPGAVAGYSEALGNGSTGGSNPGDASGSPSPFGGDGGSGTFAAQGPDPSQGSFAGGETGGGTKLDGNTFSTGDEGGGSDGSSDASNSGDGSGNNFDGSESGNNTKVDDGPGQTTTDKKKDGNPGRTQTDPKEKMAVEWGMRADCGIEYAPGKIGRLVDEPMAATDGDGEPRIVRLYVSPQDASPDDKLDTETDDSSNHKALPKRVKKKIIRGWVRVPKSSPPYPPPHYDYSYHGTPPNKENKSGSSGGSSGTPTGGASTPGGTAKSPGGTGGVTGGGVPKPDDGPSSPTGPGDSSNPTGGSITTDTRTDSAGNTWVKETVRDASGNIVGVPTWRMQ